MDHKEINFNQCKLKTMVLVLLVLVVLNLTYYSQTLMSISSYVNKVTLQSKADISNVHALTKNTEKVFTKEIDEILLLNTTSTEELYDVKPKLRIEHNDTAQILNALNESRVVKDEVDRGNTAATKTTVVRYDILGNKIMNDRSKHANITRKDTCNKCFEHDFEYILNNPGICKLYNGLREIELLILIFTMHNNIIQRNALRDTWLTHSKNNSANIRYVFLLGKTQNSKPEKSLIKESEQFGDIIQENFVDVYRNLTFKTIMGFKWAGNNCRCAKAVLKTDDDMYVNVPKFLDIIRKYSTLLQTNVFGSCHQVAFPIRNENSKWFASVPSYPGKFYAGFCSGTGYLTSMNVTRKVFEISSNVPFFHLEDVYVALCIKKLGYRLKRFQGFNSDRPKSDTCLYNGKTLVTAHYMTPKLIRQIWNAKSVLSD